MSQTIAIRHRHTVTRGFFTVNLNVDKRPPSRRSASAEATPGTVRALLQFAPPSRRYPPAQCRKLYADGAFNASREHIDTVTNWRPHRFASPGSRTVLSSSSMILPSSCLAATDLVA